MTEWGMHYDRVGGCITTEWGDALRQNRGMMTEWGDALRQSGGMHYDRVGG